MTIPTRSDHSIPLVGYRFHPTDYEAADHFLKRKMIGRDNGKPPISQIKVCDFEPCDIPALVNAKLEDQVWRSNRRTKARYWKPTGKPRKVKAKRTEEEIGTKRSLVFYIKDHPKPRRTKWIMHEHECSPNSTLATQTKLSAKAVGRALVPELKLSFEHVSQEVLVVEGISNEIAANSSSDEYEPSIGSTIGFENHNLIKMTAMSTYDKGDLNCVKSPVVKGPSPTFQVQVTKE
ncbi:hypothetical protein RCOM_1341370 [Ricinus communis]|uniref:NAC domain-containing protein n=1 Tax=Ricinus communis TaxID=3988 RepID=B9RMX6_RICCO|nr:hypothetical protein RCOM_1341370 [Ricinus communis]